MSQPRVCRVALLALALPLGLGSRDAAGQTPAAQPAPATPIADALERDIRLTPVTDVEEWRLSVIALPPQGGQPASHAFLFIAVLPHCETPRAFAITFTIDGGDRIKKQGALLSRQQAGKGQGGQGQESQGCVDGLATVFPKGSAAALERATSVTVTLPGRELTLGEAQLAYLKRALAVEAAAAPPSDDASTATLTNAAEPLPANPAARAAAEESTAQNERAVQLYSAGRLKDARAAAQAAVAAAEKAYGPEHQEVGSVLVNLGLIERKLGDNAAAIGHYARAVTILEKRGPSQSLGIVLDNLGRARQDEKDYDGAIATTTHAIEVLSAVLGPTHEHVGYAINNLAMAQSEKGDHAAAADTCDRAIAILLPALGADNPRLKPFLDDQRTLRKRVKR